MYKTMLRIEDKTADGIKKMAKENGISMNEMINVILQGVLIKDELSKDETEQMQAFLAFSDAGKKFCEILKEK